MMNDNIINVYTILSFKLPITNIEIYLFNIQHYNTTIMDCSELLVTKTLEIIRSNIYNVCK